MDLSYKTQQTLLSYHYARMRSGVATLIGCVWRNQFSKPCIGANYISNLLQCAKTAVDVELGVREESLLAGHRRVHVVLVLLHVGKGSLDEDHRVQVTSILLVGFCLLVLVPRVAVLILVVAVVLLHKKVV